ncbi:hypothetical protein EN873_44795 [bacterium M00.F.Ca.ET.230.01.1.1]|jgi:hypothetical protein|nr:hypothetical protein [Moraxella osloensis]TGP42998.1 hypothetical protein EN873_44795 [bacterium M00.F.Ca.ET.230.01.1.1]
MQLLSENKLTFKELNNNINMYINHHVKMTGIIVIIDNELYLIDSDYADYTKNYKQSIKIKLLNKDVAFLFREVILRYSGGESFIFHKATIDGKILSKENEIIIDPFFVTLEQDFPDNTTKLFHIRIDNDKIEFLKKNRFPIFDFDKNSSNDWLDYF